MPSINLLPKNIKFKTELAKKEKSNVAFIVSLLMLFLPVVFFAGLRVDNYYALKEITTLNSDIKIANEKIEKEVSDNKFLVAETKAKKNNLLLAKHTYFTKVLDIVRNNLIEDVYLDKLFISAESDSIVINFSGIAKDYQSVMSQMHILKNLPNIKSANVTKVSVNDDGREVFEGILKFKKDIIFYKN